jgi:hypothetical protein
VADVWGRGSLYDSGDGVLVRAEQPPGEGEKTAGRAAAVVQTGTGGFGFGKSVTAASGPAPTTRRRLALPLPACLPTGPFFFPPSCFVNCDS